MTDEFNFTKWIKEKLFNFITTKYDDQHSFYNVYCSFDYTEVQNIFEEIQESSIARKPIIHLFENNPSNSPFYNDKNQGKVQITNWEYSIFSIIDDKVEEGRDRKLVLDDISSNIKYKFDNHKDKLPRFRNITIGYSQGILNTDADNKYACNQRLRFEVFKKVSG